MTVNSGGTLSPGSSTAILNTGSLSFTTGSTLSDRDQRHDGGRAVRPGQRDGDVTLGGATLNVALGFTPIAGQTFTIIANRPCRRRGGHVLGVAGSSIVATGAGQLPHQLRGRDGQRRNADRPECSSSDRQELRRRDSALNETTTLTVHADEPDRERG